MNDQEKNRLLVIMTESLELPETAYEKAISRYQDLGAWLCRVESTCTAYEPHVLPQGSFRLGTAIRPLDEKEEYDLDLICKLLRGIGKQSSTQESLKMLVGREIESYRTSRGIESPTEEKHRCWRLNYADKVSFHMDIVPCIPETQIRRQSIREAMVREGASQDLSNLVSETTVSITDDRHARYRQICDDWNISNPEGYGQWFVDRMKQISRVVFAEAHVDDIPLYKRKTPLQRIVQLLKRHRDQMFKTDPDVKPISIIITTLAARAYQGEADMESGLRSVLSRMGGLVRPSTPRVPNPVDPAEDFADRWSMPEYRHLRLEDNFWNWLAQAQTDFDILRSSDDPAFISEQAVRKLAVRMDEQSLRVKVGLTGSAVATPKSHSITEPAKPWVER